MLYTTNLSITINQWLIKVYKMASTSTSGTIEWNYDNIEKLIELYEQRPCLYDTKSKDHFNRNVALQDIAKVLNTTGKSIKTQK